MGFQNENKLEVDTLVKATINGKVVEAKVIGIGFNRVTLRSEKGNEASYAFNSEKFLKWFNQVPLNEVAKNHAESGKKDLLEGLKIVTSGPSVKERTTTPKEKESKYKLDFDFADEQEGGFITLAELYSNASRSQRLGELFSPMSYDGNGFQASLIILHVLSYVSSFKHHSNAEFNAMIENRDTEDCLLIALIIWVWAMFLLFVKRWRFMRLTLKMAIKMVFLWKSGRGSYLKIKKRRNL
ncbi:hypothetical protein VN1349_06910 [Helicobacter pylori]|nr:hypothetical protein VN1263_13400 [Helicobacter pylori]